MNSVNVGGWEDFEMTPGITAVTVVCDHIDNEAAIINGYETEMENRRIDRKGSVLEAVVALRPTSCATASWAVSASTLARLPLEAFPLLLAAETQDDATDVVQACGVQS